jgi:sugar/nucleoside kinase (ribokinase family)
MSSFTREPRRSRSGVDVCIIGNLTIDVIMRGIEEMPHWGQEALSNSRAETAAGQAGGMAFASVAMGARVDVVADVGDDDTGARIRHELEVAGVGVATVSVVSGGTTPLTVAVVRGDGERAFITDLGNLRPFDILEAVQQSPDVLEASVVALVGTSNLPGIDLDAAARVFAAARRAGAITAFDSGWDPDGWSPKSVAALHAVLAETDLYLPNLDEARALTGRSDVTEVLEDLSSLCAGVVIVKCGEVGSYAALDRTVVLVEAVSTVVDNAVGAGDVYDAAVVAGFLRERDVLASMALGTAAASLYVSRRHDRFPTFEEVETLAQRVSTSVVQSWS